MANKIGMPSNLIGPKPGFDCEYIEVPFECVNDTAANVTITTQQIINKAMAGASANSATFSNGSAVADVSPQIISNIEINVLCAGQAVCLDDGTEFTPTNESLAVKVYPNGGTNCMGLSCGGSMSLGRGKPSSCKPITRLDTVLIEPGAGLVGCVTVVLCLSKNNAVEDCPLDFTNLTPAQTLALCNVVSQCAGWGGGGSVDFSNLTVQQTQDLCVVVNTCPGINPVVNAAPIAFVPTASGNATNFNMFVTDPNGDIWFIDENGLGVKLYNMSAQPPVITPAPIAFVPTPTGNATNRNSFVIDPAGDCWFIDTTGRAKKIELNVTQHSLIAGTNVIVTGAGTLADPWVVNASGGAIVGNGAPVGPCVHGATYFDRVTDQEYYCDGTSWVLEAGGGCGSAPITESFVVFSMGDVTDSATTLAELARLNICKVENLTPQFNQAERSFRIYFAGAMPNDNYKISYMVDSHGGELIDSSIFPVLFFNKGLYSVDVVLSETASSVQSLNLEVHLEEDIVNVFARLRFNFGDVGPALPVGGTVLSQLNIATVTPATVSGEGVYNITFTAASPLSTYVVEVIPIGAPIPNDVNICHPVVINKGLLGFAVHVDQGITIDGLQNLDLDINVYQRATVISQSTSYVNLQLGDIFNSGIAPTVIAQNNVASVSNVVAAASKKSFRVNFLLPELDNSYIVKHSLYGTAGTLAADGDLGEVIIFNKTPTGYSVIMYELFSTVQNAAIDLWTQRWPN